MSEVKFIDCSCGRSYHYPDYVWKCQKCDRSICNWCSDEYMIWCEECEIKDNVQYLLTGHRGD